MFGVYDYVYGHYESVRSLTGADFLERNPAVVASSNIVNNIPTTETSNLIVIVSVVSLVSASTLVGLIVLKRRKGITK